MILSCKTKFKNCKVAKILPTKLCAIIYVTLLAKCLSLQSNEVFVLDIISTKGVCVCLLACVRVCMHTCVSVCRCNRKFNMKENTEANLQLNLICKVNTWGFSFFDKACSDIRRMRMDAVSDFHMTIARKHVEEIARVSKWRSKWLSIRGSWFQTQMWHLWQEAFSKLLTLTCWCCVDQDLNAGGLLYKFYLAFAKSSGTPVERWKASWSICLGCKSPSSNWMERSSWPSFLKGRKIGLTF